MERVALARSTSPKQRKHAAAAEHACIFLVWSFDFDNRESESCCSSAALLLVAVVVAAVAVVVVLYPLARERERESVLEIV